jgi:hypothetical protein
MEAFVMGLIVLVLFVLALLVLRVYLEGILILLQAAVKAVAWILRKRRGEA